MITKYSTILMRILHTIRTTLSIGMNFSIYISEPTIPVGIAMIAYPKIIIALAIN